MFLDAVFGVGVVLAVLVAYGLGANVRVTLVLTGWPLSSMSASSLPQLPAIPGAGSCLS